MPPTRREFLKILSVVAIPLPDFIGDPVMVYLSLLNQKGEEVTQRVPVEFKWNHAVTLTLGEGHNLTFSGLALFESQKHENPLRVKTFEPIRLTPEVTLEINYTLK
jgi:hypothetical protein